MKDQVNSEDEMLSDERIIKVFECLLTEKTGDSSVRLCHETRLLELDGMNSFLLIQLIGEIEEKFDIRIPNADVGRFLDVQAAADYVRQAVLKKQNGCPKSV